MSLARLVALLLLTTLLGACDGPICLEDFLPGTSALSEAPSAESDVGVVGDAADDATLSSAGTCAELESTLRARLRQSMHGELDANLATMLADPWANCSWDEGGFWMGDDTVDRCGSPWGSDDMPQVNNAAPPPQPEPEQPDNFTDTNNQVGGVAEPDRVKTDGSFIYLASGQQLLIFKSWPAASSARVGALALEGVPTRLVLSGDRVAVYSRVGAELCAAGIGGSDTKITVVDVSDRSAPRVERELRIDGQLVGGRRVGSVLYSVIDTPNRMAMNLSTWPSNSCGAGATQIEADFDLLRQENDRLIDTASLDALLPTALDIDINNGSADRTSEGVLSACAEVLVPSSGAALGALSLVAVDIADDSTLSVTTLAGARGVIYATAETLYVGARQFVGLYGETSRTALHRFNLAGAATPPPYEGSTTLPGYLVGQFALDEEAGYLRVVTHDEMPWLTSHAFVLEPGATAQGEPALSLVGEVRDIGGGESLRAVRFDGDRGYLVTFQRTDPLWVLDFSAPTAPAVMGELWIPGFSTYMHVLDSGHLLTVGFDGQGDSFDPVALQIFDVSNPYTPWLLHKQVVGNGPSASEATSDHLAFTFFPSRDLLALPVTLCDGWGDQVAFSGLQLYRVDASSGFNLLGSVDHGGSGGACNLEAWQSRGSDVKRSIVMTDNDDDYVYSISTSLLKVNRATDLGNDLASFTLPAPVCSAAF